jgi:hypothetical protein
VQPVVGAISDGSTSRWGRRRPLLVLGTVVVAISLLVLGFTREIVGLFEPDGERAKWPTIALAVLAIYAVDFAINVGACLLSLVLRCILCRQADRRRSSNVLLKESCRRYSTHRQAASGGRLG